MRRLWARTSLWAQVARPLQGESGWSAAQACPRTTYQGSPEVSAPAAHTASTAVLQHRCLHTTSYTQQSQQSSPAQHQSVLSVQEHEKACWDCKHHIRRGSFACQRCEKIQPADPSLNYFELLGIPRPTFDLSPSKLEHQYKMLQWSLHPDKVVSKPPAERANAAQRSTLVNHAYSILRQPLSRANYMLSLHGIHLADNLEGTIDDKELLMEVMEAREAVEDTDDPGELQAMLRDNHEQQAKLVDQLKHLFAEQKYEDTVPVVTRLTYVTKLEHEIKEKLPAMA